MTIRLTRFILFGLSLLFLVSSCKRINEATDLGDDLLPGIDGVHTFDTTLTSLQTFNHIFEADKDSVAVFRSDDHILGNISGDPLFGKTNAKIFLELKPSTYPWSFSQVYNKDSLQIDSVVLVLGWKATYGDTTAPQKINVWEIDDPNNDFRIDSFYTIYDPGFSHIFPSLCTYRVILNFQTLIGLPATSTVFFPYNPNDGFGNPFGRPNPCCISGRKSKGTNL